MENVEVSIICNAYNHEKYIRSAIEGFVMQKTNFRFEVLIHDDASTDNTANIIKEYEAKYPDIIFPIYQSVNQYSQGIKITQKFQVSRAKGKYIAVCEGDDYWIDPYKLQKQYDMMELHPEVDICAHSAILESQGEKVGEVCPAKQDCIFNTEDVINGGGGFVATASLFYRSGLWKVDPPKFREVFAYDYSMQIYGALRGGMLFLADCMSVYRVATESSWTVSLKKSKEKRKQHVVKVIKMLQQLNVDTNKKYDDVISRKIIEHEFNLYRWNRKYFTLLSKKYRAVFFSKILKKFR